MKPQQILRQKAYTAARLVRRTAEVWRRDGMPAAARLVQVSFAGFLPWRWKRDERSNFDREHGVDTSGIVRIASMNIESSNYIYGHYYKASRPEQFHALIGDLGIPYREYTFLDYGCGKGLTLLLASDYPFRRIVGVEFARDLAATARHNANRYRDGKQECPAIEVVCCDAAEFEPPAGPLVIYSYDPFGLPVWRRVMERLTASYAAQPRPILLVFQGAPSSSAMNEEASEREELFRSQPLFTGFEKNGDALTCRSIEAEFIPEGAAAGSSRRGF